MLFTTGSNARLEIYTPQEVLAHRIHWSDKRFPEPNVRDLPPTQIAKKIADIVKVYGPSMLDNVLFLSQELILTAEREYDFKYGTTIRISTYILDQFGKRDSRYPIFLEYAVAFLTTLGWVVSVHEEDNRYLHLHPLQHLTPEEVDLEIERRVNQFAHQSLQVINHGLIIDQIRFGYQELGFGEVPGTLVLLVYKRLAELVQPEFEIVYENNYHLITVYRNTPN